MKRVLYFALTALLVLSLLMALASCGPNNNNAENNGEGANPSGESSNPSETLPDYSDYIPEEGIETPIIPLP